jgi:hypothetical protein
MASIQSVHGDFCLSESIFSDGMTLSCCVISGRDGGDARGCVYAVLDDEQSLSLIVWHI